MLILIKNLEHTNWVAEQYKNQGPFIISILKAKIEDSYPAIIWNPHSPYFLEKILISSNDIKIRPFHSQPMYLFLKKIIHNIIFYQRKR